MLRDGPISTNSALDQKVWKEEKDATMWYCFACKNLSIM